MFLISRCYNFVEKEEESDKEMHATKQRMSDAASPAGIEGRRSHHRELRCCGVRMSLQKIVIPTRRQKKVEDHEKAHPARTDIARGRRRRAVDIGYRRPRALPDR